MQAEEERRKEEEKQKERDKKQAFLNRAAAFQQKKGPTDEEVKAQIQKESQKRTLSRKLNRLLQDEPSQNPFALELNMKGKAQNVKEAYINNLSDWELIEDPGQRPYYWNRVTKETSYDPPEESGKPKPPPPPPPRMLVGGAPPPPPPRPPTYQVETIAETEENVEEVPISEQPVSSQQVEVAKSPWVYVCENEPNPYYWNMETNETTFEVPEGYTGEIYRSNESDQVNPSDANAGQVIWSELYTEAGEVYYQNSLDGSYSYERPEGQVVIVMVDEEGNEISWQEYYENEQILYMNLTTGEVITERPLGTVCIYQS